jgi:hypothetical protein
VAVLHGPIVLAAKTGSEGLEGLIADDGRFAHIAPGPYRPLEEAPFLVGDPGALAEGIVPVPGKPLTFSAAALIRPDAQRGLELVPFFRVHDARYVLYWPTATPERYREVVKEVEARERERLALEARTLDQVAPGEQQPEVEHGFRGEDSDTGVHLGRRWRDAGGWFGYELRAPSGEALELAVRYWGGQRNRAFDVVVEGRVIASVQLAGRSPDRFVEETYAVPSDVVAAAAGRLDVRFVAHPGSRAGAVYGVRLLRGASPE